MVDIHPKYEAFFVINIFMMFQFLLEPEGTGIVWRCLDVSED